MAVRVAAAVRPVPVVAAAVQEVPAAVAQAARVEPVAASCCREAMAWCVAWQASAE